MHRARRDGSDGIISGMQLIEERVHSAYLRLSRGFGVIGCCWVEVGVYFVEGAGL